MRVHSFSKRIFSAICAVGLSLSLLPGVYAVDPVYKKSGDLAAPKMTQGEIAQLLSEAPTQMPSPAFEVQPSYTAPYAAGKLTEEVLQRATDRLNALRTLAGLPEVTCDPALSESAQYGAVVLAANNQLSHTPSKPADMDDEFYQKGYDATSSSNLCWGGTVVSSVDLYMDDSDESNISMLGHRRWQLNPTLGKVGFGAAGAYSAEKVFDHSGSGCDYDFIAWPASGNFPTEYQHDMLFYNSTAWSVTLNPSKYQTPDISQVTVTLKRESDGTTWTFSQASADGYFNVNTGGYGVSNCIIFRPSSGITEYEGLYTVTINGLKDRSGNAVNDFAYQVTFFDATNAASGCTHEHQTHYNKVSSTCTTQGHAEYTKCDDCGAILDGSDALLPLLAHQYSTLYPEKPAKCEETGRAAYYQCYACSKYFDENKVETTWDELTIPALGHNWGDWQTSDSEHWKVCSRCNEKAEQEAHTLTWVVDKAATETETGLKHQECSVCGFETNETVIEKLDHVHTGIVHHDAVPATCVSTGTAEYWTCSSPLCDGKYYGDADCSVVLTTIETPIDPNNHVGGTEQRGAVGATCTMPGHEADTYCTSCGAKIADGAVIPALGHDYSITESNADGHWKVCSRCNEKAEQEAHTLEWVVDKAATETETGLMHQECSVCGFTTSEGTVIEKLDHVHTGIEHHDAVPATCVSTGTAEYWTCSSPLCNGKYYGDATCSVVLNTIETPINPNNHVGGTEQKNAMGATCTMPGHEADTYCTSCGAKIADGAVIPALGHDYSITKSDADGHWKVCSRCGDATAKEAHKGGKATCSEQAVCTVCETSYGALDPTVHLHTELRNEVAATETSEGYTGDTWCTDCNTKVAAGQTIEKLSHQMVYCPRVNPTCSSEGTVEHWICQNPECKGKYYADKDGTKLLADISIEIDAANHTGKTEVRNAKSATCVQEGYTGDTYCVACGALLKKGEATPKTAHQYVNGVCAVCGVADPAAPAPNTSAPATTDAAANVPQTGDPAMIAAWSAMALLSAVGLTGIGVRKGKKSRK